jgi:DNA-directed RNA polymerase specialized sigma24 family protein
MAMQVRQRDPKKAPASKVRAQHADEEERLLIERVKVSDHEAFEALFHRYLSRVYRQAIRLLGDQAEAEEVVQEVFTVVVLSDLEARSDREIGAALGLSVSAVKSRLHRARLFLRGKLAVALGNSPT